MVAHQGFINTGPATYITYDRGWTGATGPASFGTGALTRASTSTGDSVAISGTFSPTSALVALPLLYVSGSTLSNSSTWDNASFASLGVKPGTYVWTWGTAADQSFTLDIANAVGVPEPAALGMFGFGALLIGGFVGLRRRVA